jgi:hypothetical protein
MQYFTCLGGEWYFMFTNRDRAKKSVSDKPKKTSDKNVKSPTDSELDYLRGEVSRLNKSLEALTDLSNRRRIEIQVERIKGALLTELEEATRSCQELAQRFEEHTGILEVLTNSIPYAVVITELPGGKEIYSNELYRQNKDLISQGDLKLNAYSVKNSEGLEFASIGISVELKS